MENPVSKQCRDSVQMPHNVASDLGLRCLPVSLYRFPGKNGLLVLRRKKLMRKKKKLYSPPLTILCSVYVTRKRSFARIMDKINMQVKYISGLWSFQYDLTDI